MDVKTGEVEYDIIKQFHDEAYAHVDQALTLEEEGQSLQALALYEKGLRLLDQGLSVCCDRPNCISERWDTMRLMQMKMRKTKDHVLTRLEDLSKARAAEAAPPYTDHRFEMPPSYEEACSPGPYHNGVDPAPPYEASLPGPSGVYLQNGKKSFHDLCHDNLQPMDIDEQDAYSQVPAEAKAIFSIADGVQIFFVSSNGHVSAPSYPTALTVYKFSDGSLTPTGQRRPPAFLEVGHWVYPLHPGRLPVLHTTYGAYMLPDTNCSQPGSAVGILLADDVPQSVREVFEHLMCELTALQNEPEPPPSERRLSTKISDGIVTGAEIVSKGVLIGAEKTSEYVRIGARKLRQRMDPARSPTYIDPRVQRGLQIAKDVSNVAVRVSGFVVSQLGRATMALGNHLAPHVRRHGTSLISKALGEDQPDKASAAVDGVMEVASGGLKGVSKVYLGLEQAATILAKNLISETVQTVNYRYGNEAALSTGTTLHTVTNVALTANNIHHMGIKAIAKSTAKNTGKAMVQQHEQEKQGYGSQCGVPPNEDLNKK